MKSLIKTLFFLFCVILVILTYGCSASELSFLKNVNTNFDKNNSLNIMYEYGKVNNKKLFKYNIETGNKEEDIESNMIFDTNFSEIINTSNAGVRIAFVYNDSQKKEGIFFISEDNTIIKEIVTWDYLEKRFKFLYGISQLLYEQKNNKLYFHISSSNEILVSIDLTNNCLTEIINYVPIYYQYYYNKNYILKNKNIFVIDKSNNICIYNIVEEKLVNTNCNAYNFTISNDGKYIYYINLHNELCMYSVDDNISKTLMTINNKVERIDINKTNNFLLLVETLNKGTLFGIDTSKWFKQNELNLYEISTGKKITIQKPDLFNIVLNAKFVDE